MIQFPIFLAKSKLSANAPFPVLISMTKPSKPAASFLDKIDAVIRGIDSIVAVTSLTP